MVAQRRVAGLYNYEHQSKILTEAPLLPTLADKTRTLRISEATRQSVDFLHKIDKPDTEAVARPLQL